MPFLSKAMQNDRGITIIEMLVSISILAVLATMAMPNLSSILNKHRSSALLMDLYGTIRYAQSESATRSNVVFISAITKQKWQEGWQVFVDTNNNYILDNSDERLRVSRYDDNNTVLSSNLNLDTIVLSPQGYIKLPDTASSVIFFICGDDSMNDNQSLLLQRSGNILTEEQNENLCL